MLELVFTYPEGQLNKLINTAIADNLSVLVEVADQFIV